MHLDDKRKKEMETIHFMISLYCRKKHHHDGLCMECEALYAYAKKRISCCPFMETKTFCSTCKIHCYQKEQRKKIKEVMRFSGPRMLFYHPKMAFQHMFETWKGKKRL